MILLMIFLWGMVGAVAYFDLLPFWILIVGGVFVSIAIIGMNLFASSNKPGTTTTTNTSDSDDSSGDATTASTPTTPASSSSTSWGGVVVGLVLAAILIGVFVWTPWENNSNISSAISKADQVLLKRPVGCPNCFMLSKTVLNPNDGTIGITIGSEIVGKDLYLYNMTIDGTKWNGPVEPCQPTNFFVKVPSTGTMYVHPVEMPPPKVLWGFTKKST